MFIDEEVDPASLPQKDGKPVPRGEELSVTDEGEFHTWLCKDCVYCRGEWERGREKPPALCWHHDPDGPPAPQPIRIYQKACKHFDINLGMDYLDRLMDARWWEEYNTPDLVFVHDGESFHSGMSYRRDDPECREIMSLKGHNW
jgi:hypothetical protein